MTYLLTYLIMLFEEFMNELERNECYCETFIVYVVNALRTLSCKGL